MEVICQAVDEHTPMLGRTYQRLLSATAHSRMRVLARMLATVEPSTRPGEVLAAINRDPRSLAVELVVGPLAAFNLVIRLEWFCGLDMTSLHGPANRMLMVWFRVAQRSVTGLGQ